MARARNYAAEYAARQQRAQERGFSSYAEERQFRTETVEERREAAEALGVHPNIGDPTALTRYYEDILLPIATEEEVSGRMRHDAVAYFVDVMGYSEEDAIAAMRELYGDSPGAE
jgi:hypothetical protein